MAPSGLHGPRSGHPDTSLPGAAPSCPSAQGSPPAQPLSTEGDPQSEGGDVWDHSRTLPRAIAVGQEAPAGLSASAQIPRRRQVVAPILQKQ